MRATLAVRLAVVLVSVASGCQAPPEATVEHTVSVDMLPSGLVRTTNDGPGTWTPETAWRLGEGKRIESDHFTRITDVAIAPDGRLFVLDDLAQRVFVFDPDGTLSRTIGSPGQGPGELDDARGLELTNSGRLWVVAPRRYSVFTSEGVFIDSYPRAVRGWLRPWVGSVSAAEETIVDWGLDIEPAGTTELGGTQVMTFTGLKSYQPFRVALDGRSPAALPPLSIRAETTSDGQMKQINRNLILAVSRDGTIWFANSDHYALFSRTLEGDTLSAFTRVDRVPRAVPQALVDSSVRAWRQQGIPASADMFQLTFPVITRIVLDDAGHAFVFPQEEGLPEGEAVDVFNQAGVLLGRIQLPTRILTSGSPIRVSDTRLVAVTEGPLGVPSVISFEILKR